MSIRYRSELYGGLSLWIMLFHLNMFFNPLFGNIFLGRMATLGECCVDVFLFVSGYCICYSLQRTPNYGLFLKKRVLRILPPYLLISIPYLMWRDGLRWNLLYSLSGFSFFLDGDTDTWFPIAIMFFYCISPFLLRLLSGEKGPWMMCLLVILSIVLTTTTNFFSRTSIMWTRLPAYALGIFFARNNIKIKEDGQEERPKTKLMLLIGGTLCLFIYAFTPFLSVLSSRFGSIYTRLSYLIIILPIIFLYNETARYIPQIVRRFFSFCGKMSLELYMTHLFLLYVVSYYGLSSFMYPLALLVSILAAFFVQRIVSLIVELFKIEL